jgi:hypothetical protein
MPQKPKEEKADKQPQESTEQESTEPEPQPSPAPKELNREQLEDLRRKLQKKFH